MNTSTLLSLALTLGGGVLAGQGLALASAPRRVRVKRRGLAMTAAGLAIVIWGNFLL